nr:hypothetical protein [Acidobacteriota bacterium]
MTFLEQLESAPDYPDLLEMTLQQFHADGGTIHMLQPDGLLHLTAASRGIPEAVLAVTRTIPIGKGM